MSSGSSELMNAPAAVAYPGGLLELAAQEPQPDHEPPPAEAMKAPPDYLTCGITMELFRDPVVTTLGHSYERSAIEEWFASHSTDPLTGAALADKTLTPVHRLRSAAEAWALDNGL